jgi:hypothetical protein
MQILTIFTIESERGSYGKAIMSEDGFQACENVEKPIADGQRRCGRDDDSEQSFVKVEQIVERQMALALAAAQFASRQKLTEIGVSGAVRGIDENGQGSG